MTKSIGPTETISEDDVEVIAVDLTNWLDDGEQLTGTPTVVEVTTADLTLDNKSISLVPQKVNGFMAPAGHVVLFRMTGQQTGTTYTVKITASTNASIPRTINRTISIECV